MATDAGWRTGWVRPMQLVEIHHIRALQNAKMHGLVGAFVKVDEVWGQSVTDPVLRSRTATDSQARQHRANPVAGSNSLDNVVALEHHQQSKCRRFREARPSRQLAHAQRVARFRTESEQDAERLVDRGSFVSD